MNNLGEIIREEIESGGPVPFERFMEMALYYPGGGYYERRRNIGWSGDFFTSASVGSLFGGLLGRQFADWIERYCGEGNSSSRVQVVEAGAHDGRLAADVLAFLHRFEPTLAERLDYLILEPSTERQEWQRERLAVWSDRITWFNRWEALPPRGIRGVIFSNELLDAFPVRRFGWDRRAARWFEWGVGVQGGRFVWRRLESRDGHAAFPTIFRERQDILPDGYIVETCPAAVRWWETAAGRLHSGVLMTIDYGLVEHQLVKPERVSGTLRAYHRHRVENDPLRRPGEQDLTASVNFVDLREAGERMGLTTVGIVSQEKFLTEIAVRMWKRNPPDKAQVRQFQTLTHPEHLGRAFLVLTQKRPA